DRRDRVLDLARDLGFHLSRRDARIRDRDDHGRELDVGPVLNTELREADQARDREPDEQDDDGRRIANRPGDEVHEPASELTSTRSPSFKKPAPFPTTMSPASRPFDTSISASCT